MNPDYKRYTLIELYDVKENIDKKLYPERYGLLLTEIELREQSPDKEPKPSKFDEKNKASILKFIMTMCALFFSWNLINAFINGSIKSRGGHVYHLATNPQGFHFIVFLHIVFIIVALYIVFKDFGKRNT